MSIKNNIVTAVSSIVERFVRPRQFWEKRAANLNGTKGWYVGRTDMYSFVKGEYVHYAYSPDSSVQRVPFLGRGALRRAVKYAERENRRANDRLHGREGSAAE